MINFLEIIVNGILLGSVYGLAAVGMGLIFGVMGVLNLAHGAFMLMGGAISWFLVSSAGMGLPLTIPASVFSAGIVGLFLWKWGLAVPFSYNEDETGAGDLSSQLLVTLGFSLFAEDLVTRWSPQGVFSIPLEYPVITLSDISFSSIRILLLFMVVSIFLIFNRILMKTDLGLMIRACIQEREGAILMSVPYSKISLAVFGAGCAMAGLAGSFYLILYPLTPQMSIPLTIKALLIVILGGTGRFLYTLVASILLGLFEVAAGFWTSAETQHVIPHVALVVLLLISPAGIGSLNKNRFSY
ncbi:branched-chain amino acid ABC transporter permease [Thermodesulfobacteriota bacterium]